MMEERSVTVVIPAYNEAETIGKVVSGVVGLVDEVVVVDDGSGDGTGTLAESHGATVLEHQVNRGYDRSLGDGVAYAAQHGADTVVTFDADGQHDPADIKRVIEPIHGGRVSIVVGRRPEFARPAERVFGLYAKWRLGVDDPLSGFKAYDVTVYEDVGYFDEYSSIGTHLMVAAVKRGYDVGQVDINVSEREDEPRFGQLRANWRMFQALVRIVWFDVRTTVRRSW